MEFAHCAWPKLLRDKRRTAVLGRKHNLVLRMFLPRHEQRPGLKPWPRRALVRHTRDYLMPKFRHKRRAKRL